MSGFFRNVRKALNNKIGFFLLTVILFWAKTYYVYLNEFTLGSKGLMQQILLFVNPIPSALLLFGIALYFRGKLSYVLMMIINMIQSLWLFANILYYREFSDFISFGIIKGAGGVQNNLGKSLVEILHPLDFIVFADILLALGLLLFKVIKIDDRRIKFKFSIGLSILSLFLIFAEYQASNADRSGLLTRTFDNNYIVKYLGLNEYAVFSAYQTHKEVKTKKDSKPSDLDEVKKYIKNNNDGINPEYFGKEKGKNVFIIHLESFQQFLINYKVNGKYVTPNLNKFYKNKHTLSFDNFYHQVAQGKTADAEMMMENSLYGLPQGSAMSSYGTSNTYQAAPAILNQKGYTTAAFHGDVPSFWNRDNTYKSWGYQYFFDKEYYNIKPNYNIGYGLKDKIFLKDSVKYIEKLPQPFYAKLITLTNHYPYELDKQNVDFPSLNTGDNTVDPYVQTAHYLDQAFKEFINYLKKTGLMKNSMIVLYGDHYGISDNHKPAIAKLLKKKNINNYDLAEFKKVPFMIYGNNIKGKVDHTYGGEIDALPTIMHLLGIKTNKSIMFGQDLLSNKNEQIVPFRNGDFVTNKYTKIGNDVFKASNGKPLKLNINQSNEVSSIQSKVDKELSLSDKVIYGDLLRFYQLKNFKSVDKTKYNYGKQHALSMLNDDDKKDKDDLISKLKVKSTENMYKTDAPELKKE
ncbi:sulfatase-like hydrolase/transferase [Lactobacillus sp. S2-2]|uniref:LTA synthase family protein n=1 Tax=Lactobacillus sp. S2-2 TaxID=2692917 RepID=UPI001F1AB707|nr:LTA synthase family protein [Lactobacillus sp. S2-2]MCF6514836.1 sulfatase-like hydrolase/transferase [Lactobacillus sp. S2-2]